MKNAYDGIFIYEGGHAIAITCNGYINSKKID